MKRAELALGQYENPTDGATGGFAQARGRRTALLTVGAPAVADRRRRRAAEQRAPRLASRDPPWAYNRKEAKDHGEDGLLAGAKLAAHRSALEEYRWQYGVV